MSNRPPTETAPAPDSLYGLHPVEESLRANRRRFHEVLVDAKAPGDRFAGIRRLAEQAGVRVHTCNKHDLFETCGSRQHQGVVLVTDPFPLTPLSDDIFTRDRLLLLDNLEDPRNTGAILRSAHLFGFHTILLPLKGGSGIYPSVVRTSAGASEHLDIVQGANGTRYFQNARKAGYRTVALDAQGGTDLRAVPADDPRPLLLILGGEDKRIGQFILNEAEVVARIPQRGRINSLNASVAAGIALYHFSPSDS